MKKIFFILLVTLAAGCIFGGGEERPSSTYVTPCNVISNGVIFRANGSALSTEIVREPLSRAFVDDITSDKAAGIKRFYGVSCYWGSNPGELKQYYYCNGSYVAPEVNDQGVILRNLRKEFKIGFSYQRYPEVSSPGWTDMNGKFHPEDVYFDLTVRTVEARCTVY